MQSGPANDTSAIFVSLSPANSAMRKIYFTIILVTFTAAAAFKTGPVNKAAVTSIQFKHWVGNKTMVLFDETYTNSFGEPFVISKFRYYISHISFVDVNNKETRLPENYYLINEADSLSKIIQLPATAALQSISFWIGIDSIKNTGAVQTGSLDPANGMFWTWNSGYVFAKLEGLSDSSHAPAHGLTWDVGGFRQKENAVRTITLKLNNPQTSANNTIVVNADVLKWFDAIHPLKIAQSPTCHQPGKLAMQIADNYSNMFSIAP